VLNSRAKALYVRPTMVAKHGWLNTMTS